jgi:hypothetical protein
MLCRRCLKCNAFGAWSSDLRTIQKAHHVTLDGEFAKRVKLEPHPQPKKFDNWENRAAIRCVKCHEDWGIKALCQGVSYHVLKASGFVIVGPHDERSRQKRWKDVPFAIEELSVEDMKIMSQRASSE